MNIQLTEVINVNTITLTEVKEGTSIAYLLEKRVDGGAGGLQGPKGDTGEQGIQGVPGNDGADGVDGQDGAQGVPGNDGADGQNGTDGQDASLGDYQIISNNYTVLNTDGFIEATQTLTATLPTTGTSTGKIFQMGNSGTGILTYNVEGGGTIQGELFQEVNQGENHTVVFNGTNYRVI